MPTVKIRRTPTSKSSTRVDITVMSLMKINRKMIEELYQSRPPKTISVRTNLLQELTSIRLVS